MKYRYQQVHPQFTDYIRTILVFDSAFDTESSKLPLWVKGMPALLCKTENNCHQITLFGQSVPNENWAIDNHTTLIAFFFKPFTLSPIFNLPAKELKETPVELTLWNAQKAMALSIQLFHSQSTEESVEILNHFILSQIQNNRRECEIIRQATDTLMQHPNAETLSLLLQDLNLTERTFQRIFKKYTGITANEYRRICQFYFSFSQLKGGHFDKLTDVAYANGYFDQSHYIRSFREFTKITPGEYLQSGLGKKN